MGTERDGRTQGSRTRPGAGRPADLRRIPLPPLPAFRQRAGETGRPPGAATPASPGRGLSDAEQEGLLRDDPAAEGLLPGPGHEVRPDPLGEPAAPRTGALGATILNDLVEEIERDLERDLGRHPPQDVLPAYRRAAGCSFMADDEGR
jgi:hypothetical protein